MKILDRDGRLFGKISIIDVIVILVVAVLAAAIYVKSQMPQTGSSVTTTTVVYQMLLRNQPEYMLDAIQVGDQLFDQARSTNGSLGTITDIQVSDGTSLASFPDGTAAVVPAEGYYDLLLTIEAQAMIDGNGMVLINRVYAMGVNTNRTFTTKYASFSGRVTDLQVAGADGEG